MGSIQSLVRVCQQQGPCDITSGGIISAMCWQTSFTLVSCSAIMEGRTIAPTRSLSSVKEDAILNHTSRFAAVQRNLDWDKTVSISISKEGMSLADRRVHRIANGTPEPCVRWSGTTRLAV